MKAQNLSDKLLVDKLDSLEGLPLGYNPNLENKWALIESSLNQKSSKKTVLYFIATALGAASIIFVGIGLFLYSKSALIEIKAETVVQNKKLKNSISTSNTAATAHKLSKHKEAAKVKSCSNEVIFVTTIPSTTPEPILIDSTPIVSIDTTATITNNLIKVKKLKPRYFQLDFETPNYRQEETVKAAGNSTGLQFKIKANTVESEAENSDKSKITTIRINL